MSARRGAWSSYYSCARDWRNRRETRRLMIRSDVKPLISRLRNSTLRGTLTGGRRSPDAGKLVLCFVGPRFQERLSFYFIDSDGSKPCFRDGCAWRASLRPRLWPRREIASDSRQRRSKSIRVWRIRNPSKKISPVALGSPAADDHCDHAFGVGCQRTTRMRVEYLKPLEDEIFLNWI